MTLVFQLIFDKFTSINFSREQTVIFIAELFRIAINQGEIFIATISYRINVSNSRITFDKYQSINHYSLNDDN